MNFFIYLICARNILVYFFFSVIFCSSCFGMTLFKLGFEFQEGSGLCPGASKNYNIQKKPLFSLREENGPQTLWHVEFDTDDIEFVTRPFAPQEEGLLRQCIESIRHSIQTLREEDQKIPFKRWFVALKKIYRGRLVIEDKYREVEDIVFIEKPDNWVPKFSPQVTIQHPLKHTIFLYFGLFGFNHPSHMFPFVASLPYLDLFLQFHKEADSIKFNEVVRKYNSPICGLTFLQALTMVQMTPEEDDTDSSLLASTYRIFTDFQQVDPKIRLTLMSRRPFSDMLHDINLPTPSQYPNFFFDAMINHNKSFSKFYKVPHLFYRANYAEQYFASPTGNELFLCELLPFFREAFVQENRDVLRRLLERGVVSTVMIRNLKENIQGAELSSLIADPLAYFERIVKSVATPTKRYIVDRGQLVIKKESVTYDCLSPPEFLNLDNSMGALKGENLLGQDMTYGEAIVEVRGIKLVQDWFMKRAGLNPAIKGTFLTIPGENLVGEAIALFKFLESFGTPIDEEDIKLGMACATYTH